MCLLGIIRTFAYLQPKNKEKEKGGQPEEEKKSAEGEKLGSGRLIPIKQGYLYKKSHGLNKEWKKKYVTLLTDGRLTYHPSLHVSIIGQQVSGGGGGGGAGEPMSYTNQTR